MIIRRCVKKLNTWRTFSRTCSSRIDHRSSAYRVLFFGTDDFSVKHLEALNENRLTGVSPVEQLDVVIPRHKHKICDVGVYCSEHDIPVTQWPVTVQPGVYDVGVIVSFGRLIPAEIISAFKWGMLNVHPSQLPRWRGAAPIQHTLLARDSQTAVTIMHILPHKFDVGPILAQELLDVPPHCELSELRSLLADHGSKLLLRVLQDLPHFVHNASPQSTSGATHAFKLTAVNAQVNWEQQSASDVDCQFRVLGHNLNLRSEFAGQAVRLLDMVPPVEFSAMNCAVLINTGHHKPGTVLYDKQHQILCIRCKDDWIGFRTIVHKKPMTAKSFYNGYISKSLNYSVTLVSLENHLEQYYTRDVR